jgi:hypothetical protein
LPSTTHPLAVHPEGRGAAADEALALADELELVLVLEAEDEAATEAEDEEVVEADEADEAEDEALTDAEDDEDAEAEAEELADELAEADAEGTVAPAGPVKIESLDPPPQVEEAEPAQTMLHWVEAAATLPALKELPQ